MMMIVLLVVRKKIHFVPELNGAYNSQAYNSQGDPLNHKKKTLQTEMVAIL